jgi:hypothetical protein
MFRSEGDVLAGVAEAVGGEFIEVARRTAGLGGLPAGVEEAVLGETHEDGIERSGLEAGVAADVVSVARLMRGLEELSEDEEGLGGFAHFDFHAATLHI